MQEGFPERTIVHVLQERSRTCPNKPWIVLEDSYTYSDVDRLSNRMARGLAEIGLEAGDTLLVMLPDSIELVAIWLACAKLGIIEVPINTAYRGDILAHVVNDSLARTMIVGAPFLERALAVEGELTHLQRCLVRGHAPKPSGTRLMIAALDSAMSNQEAPLDRQVREWDIKAIMYTSGTTGRSKGVMVSHAHAHEYAMGCGGSIELAAEDVYYTAGLPLFHVAGKWGVLYAAAIQGATAVVPEAFSARDFWHDVRRHDATATFLLGAMANFLQRQPPAPDDADNPLAKALMCPLLPDLDEFARRFGVRVATAYGSTEVNAPITMALGSPVADNQIVGKVRADKFEISIVDEHDRPVPARAMGEIAVRPREPWLTMLGYWNQPEATVRAWRNLWLHSGDAGWFDEAGNFYFIDRLKDAIRRRGENISSMEVEAIINRHPAVAECAVFPIASAHTEQEVMAAVVLKPGMSVDPVKLIRDLEPRMAHFMVPRYLDFVDELPKTPTGKVKKHLLREAGLTKTTWDREAYGVKVAR